MGRKAIDLIGQVFGDLTVIERAENDGNYAQWRCICSCGKEKIIRGTSLRNGSSQSCGCKKGRKIINLTGQKIGKWTVLNREFLEDRTNDTFWKCRCECGNEKIIDGDRLRNKISLCCSSCSQMKDITNQRFGKLVAIKNMNKKIGNYMAWKCQCDCGNICEVSYQQLNSGEITSCGCDKIYQNASFGEKRIEQLLNENGIFFIQEYKNDTCRFLDTNALARFDFYVNNSYLIEFDGKQHFTYNVDGWNDKEYFMKLKQHDQYKNQWCKKNNIPLIRIPYCHLNNLCIEDLLLETSLFIV